MKIFVYGKISSNANKKNNNYIIKKIKEIYIDILIVDYDEFDLYDLSNVELIIISGGDGIIHHVINKCKEYLDKIVFSFIPTGTANDFCNNIGIKKINESIEVIKNNQIIEKEIIEINGVLCLYAMSVGEMSNVAIKSSKTIKNWFHKLVYKLKGIRYFFSKKTKVKIINNQDIEILKVKALIITNSKYLGGVKISKSYNNHYRIIVVRNIFGRFKKDKKYLEDKFIINNNSKCCIDGEKYIIEKMIIREENKKIRLLSKNTWQSFCFVV